MTSPQVAITLLVDNQSGPGLTAEHGLALWIETQQIRILFDTGQGPALPANARALGIDLSTADHLVLSHGHYDHTGGLLHVLQVAPDVHVHAHPGVVQPRYRRREPAPQTIHMPAGARAALRRLPEHRRHWVAEATALTNAIGLTGPIPRRTPYEDPGGPFFLDREAQHPDPIADDLALWIRTEDGLVVCTGCCHAGLINTIDHIRRLNGGAALRAVIGGFHLIDAEPRRLAQTVKALADLPVARIIPCHCTGDPAVRILEAVLGDKILPGAAGQTHRF